MRISKASALDMLAHLERVHSSPPVDAGDARVLTAVREVRSGIERRWTPEREREVLELERTRWTATRRGMSELLDATEFARLESSLDAVQRNAAEAAELQADALVRCARSSAEFDAYAARMRRAAATAALLPNVVEMSEQIRAKASEVSAQARVDGSFWGQTFRGELPVAHVGEFAALKLAERLGGVPSSATAAASALGAASSDEKLDDSANALRAIVRFRKTTLDRAPQSAAELAVLVHDAFPVVEDKSNQLVESQRHGKADAWASWIVKQLVWAGSADRLDAVVKALASVDPSLIASSATSLQNKDTESVERELKAGLVSLLVRLLPNVAFPPIEGERDGVTYSVKNLALSKFHVDEKHVRLLVNSTLGQVRRGDPFVKVFVDDVSAALPGIGWEFKQNYFPYLTGQGLCDAEVRGVGVVLGFQVVRRSRGKVIAAAKAAAAKAAAAAKEAKEAAAKEAKEGRGGGAPPAPTPSPAGGASSAAADDPATPPGGGGGGDDADDGVMVPQLVLGVTRVMIDHVKIDLKQSVYAMLTDMFAKSIRTYLCSLVEDMLVEGVTEQLDRVNLRLARDCWEILDAAFDVRLQEVPTAEVAAQRANELDKPVGARRDAYSVTFPQDGSLGIVLSRHHELVVVRGFKRGPQDKPLPGEASGRIKVGDVLVGFNGGEITSLPLDRVLTRLARSGRPLTLTFSPGDAASVAAATAGAAAASVKKSHVAEFKFTEERLHLALKARAAGEDRGALVTGFRDPPEGGQGPAQKAGVPVGWVLAAVNGAGTLRKTFKETTAMLAEVKARPIALRFVRDPDYEIELRESPSDLRLASFKVDDGRPVVVVSAFEQLPSPAALAFKDKLETGDFLSGVGDRDTSALKFDEVVQLVRTAPRPVELKFSRPNVGLVAAGVFKPGPLGVVFYKSSVDGRCCFKAFQGVPGPVESLKVVEPGHVLRRTNGVDVADEQAARKFLAAPLAPGQSISLAFRDMDAFKAGAWGLVFPAG